MNVNSFERAAQIQERRKELAFARQRWDDPQHAMLSLGSFVAVRAAGFSGDLPVPIQRFKRECMDAIATEEAALTQEFNAL